ncbi:MAG TPA: putative 2-aminoethylphosphonate ABC transporter substrate-binding protein [Burkholderiales bacterium]|nr:putative 2-aminoethylphosphonate ABC transporter substrate-binding protein [Burkholderiales bacterium]
MEFRSRMKWVLGAAAVIAGMVAGIVPAQAQKGTLTVYTSLQKELLGPYEAAFKKAYPDIQINWLREATGTLQARLLAEKENPRADVIFGVPIMSLVALDQAGLVQRYAPKGYENLKPHFRDKNNPPIWTGMDMYISVICFNTVEAKKRNLPRPTKWTDLANPVYRGQVTMPSPAATQTGYLNMLAWISNMGEPGAWKLMDQLHENTAMYTNSSSTPCKLAASGEYAVGLSTDITAPLLKTKGAPIDIILPEDKSGWEIEGTAIVKGTKNLEAAKTLADWSVSKAANEQYNKFMAIVAYPGIANLPQNYPANSEAMMADFDVPWGIANRTRLVNEWTKRYSSKAEPKAQ